MVNEASGRAAGPNPSSTLRRKGGVTLRALAFITLWPSGHLAVAAVLQPGRFRRTARMVVP